MMSALLSHTQQCCVARTAANQWKLHAHTQLHTQHVVNYTGTWNACLATLSSSCSFNSKHRRQQHQKWGFLRLTSIAGGSDVELLCETTFAVWQSDCAHALAVPTSRLCVCGSLVGPNPKSFSLGWLLNLWERGKTSKEAKRKLQL
jgi:hypothetical protein